MKRADVSTLEPTRYEMVVRIAGEADRLIGYSSAPSAHSILSYIRSHESVQAAVFALFGEDDSIVRVKGQRWPEWHIEGGRIRLMFSGRTQREALTAGALVWLGV